MSSIKCIITDGDYLVKHNLRKFSYRDFPVWKVLIELGNQQRYGQCHRQCSLLAARCQNKFCFFNPGRKTENVENPVTARSVGRK